MHCLTVPPTQSFRLAKFKYILPTQLAHDLLFIVFLSKLAIALMSPLGTALFLIFLGMGLAGCRRNRAGWTLVSTGFFWLVLWSWPPASNGLVGLIESEFPLQPLSSVPSAPAIVVLGGGIHPPRSAQFPPNLESGADRVWYAARLYHAGKSPRLVLSGGGDPRTSSLTEAEAMREFLGDLGVPDSVLLLESRSRTTRENAIYTAELLSQHGIRRVLLVTSALHMHRAKKLFEKEGIEVEPVPTDHEARPLSFWQKVLPDAGALENSGHAIKELVGGWLIP